MTLAYDSHASNSLDNDTLIDTHADKSEVNSDIGCIVYAFIEG